VHPLAGHHHRLSSTAGRGPLCFALHLQLRVSLLLRCILHAHTSRDGAWHHCSACCAPAPVPTAALTWSSSGGGTATGSVAAGDAAPRVTRSSPVLQRVQCHGVHLVPQQLRHQRDLPLQPLRQRVPSAIMAGGSTMLPAQSAALLTGLLTLRREHCALCRCRP
jgi:hypothetical protein